MKFDKDAAAQADVDLPIANLFFLNEYQERIAVFDFPDSEGPQADSADNRYPLWYYALGLGGEAGESVDKIKKIFRNDRGVVTDEARLALALELGDTLWYLTRIAAKIDVTLGEVARLNIEKLADRARRGVLRSAGDNR